MTLPEVHNKNIGQYLEQSEIVEETVQQITKDFGMFGIEILLSGNVENTYNELHQQLVEVVNKLMVNNFEKLWAVMYRIDISEREINKTSTELPEYSYAEVLAHQIILRELKKVLVRKFIKENAPAIRND